MHRTLSVSAEHAQEWGSHACACVCVQSHVYACVRDRGRCALPGHRPCSSSCRGPFSPAGRTQAGSGPRARVLRPDLLPVSRFLAAACTVAAQPPPAVGCCLQSLLRATLCPRAPLQLGPGEQGCCYTGSWELRGVRRSDGAHWVTIPPFRVLDRQAALRCSSLKPRGSRGAGRGSALWPGPPWAAPPVRAGARNPHCWGLAELGRPASLGQAQGPALHAVPHGQVHGLYVESEAFGSDLIKC